MGTERAVGGHCRGVPKRPCWPKQTPPGIAQKTNLFPLGWVGASRWARGLTSYLPPACGLSTERSHTEPEPSPWGGRLGKPQPGLVPFTKGLFGKAAWLVLLKGPRASGGRDSRGPLACRPLSGVGLVLCTAQGGCGAPGPEPCGMGVLKLKPWAQKIPSWLPASGGARNEPANLPHGEDTDPQPS